MQQHGMSQAPGFSNLSPRRANSPDSETIATGAVICRPRLRQYPPFRAWRALVSVSGALVTRGPRSALASVFDVQEAVQRLGDPVNRRRRKGRFVVASAHFTNASQTVGSRAAIGVTFSSHLLVPHRGSWYQAVLRTDPQIGPPPPTENPAGDRVPGFAADPSDRGPVEAFDAQ